ncbi:MAG: hypothetical protein JWN03_988 [Nocardia sp.]|uniref:S1 family peptidase n=1 Tax=Nocardia sp. TaxID=1821 RepID=UPI0026351852|nr:S1 family peptidase [Nocardia sp.]MCU1640713.1 hypothetical protein [Nocardia sp.]
MLALGRILTSIGLISAASIFALGLTPGTAAADGPAVLGGGSGIAISTEDPQLYALCTVTAIGFDGGNRLVAVTAGHCGDVGASVWSEGSVRTGVIGRVAEVDDYWDWAVIELDPDKVVPVRQITQSVVNGIGSPPGLLETVCKNGRTTGFTCGPVWQTLPEGFSSHVCADHGDSGAPVLVGDRLVGMVIAGQLLDLGSVVLQMPSCTNPADPVHEPDLSTGIGNVLTSIDQHGGAGAGFRLF